MRAVQSPQRSHPVKSTVMGSQDRLSGRVSAYLAAPCARFLHLGRVL